MRILGVLKLRIEFCRFSRGNESGPSRQGHLGHRGKHDFLAVFLATAPLGHRGKNLGPATAPATAMAPAAATAPATATTPATALWRPLCVCSMTDGLRPSRPRTPEINFDAELHLVIAESFLSKIYFWGRSRRPQLGQNLFLGCGAAGARRPEAAPVPRSGRTLLRSRRALARNTRALVRDYLLTFTHFQRIFEPTIDTFFEIKIWAPTHFSCALLSQNFSSSFEIHHKKASKLRQKRHILRRDFGTRKVHENGLP